MIIVSYPLKARSNQTKKGNLLILLVRLIPNKREANMGTTVKANSKEAAIAKLMVKINS